MDDGLKVLEFRGVRRAERNGPNEVSHAREPVLTQSCGVSDGLLNRCLVQRIALNKGRSLFDQWGDPLCVSGEKGDVVAVLKQRSGKMVGNIAAAANQKK